MVVIATVPSQPLIMLKELKALFSIAFHGPNCVTMCLSKDVMSKKADRSVSFSV